MPVIVIYAPECENLLDSIVEAVENVEEMDLKGKNLITIFHITKYVSNNNTIFVKVTIKKQPDRNLEVRNKLANIIAATIQNYFPKNRVKCTIDLFTNTQGSCSLEPKIA